MMDSVLSYDSDRKGGSEISKKRKNRRARFKAKLSPASPANEEPVAEPASGIDVQPTMISAWKRRLLDIGAGPCE